MAPYGPMPPRNFQCPYKNNCPHLEGLSTRWIWGEYQDSHDEHLEHWRIRTIQRKELQKAHEYIRGLEKENEELKAALKALHKRQFKSNRREKNNATSESDPPCPQEKKKRGAPKGHPGWFRPKPDHIDKTVIVPAPEICPHCACENLSPVEEMKDHLQEDIILQPQTHVINFKHHQAYCPKCRRPVVQAAEGELLNSQIGPTTKAAAVFLRYGLQIPYRKVQELFDVFFNMPFVPASAMAFDRQATRKGEPIYNDLKEKLRACAMAHADETYWRQNGIGYYAWYGGNEDLAYFHIDRHRSTTVAQSIFGDDFDGVLVADGYAAYNGVNPIARQSCLAHLIRKAKEIKQEVLLRKPEFQNKKTLKFCDEIAELFKEACKIGNKLLTGQLGYDQTGDYKSQFYSDLEATCADALVDEKAETLRKRLLDPKKEFHRLFVFLDYPGVPPTNNQAEQSVRHLVIFRKICFGTRTDAGSFSHSVLPSLLQTARRQGKHPLEFFQTLFKSDTATAQAALYNEST